MACEGDVIFYPPKGLKWSDINSFEYVSKNLKSYDNTLTYNGNKIDVITYDLGGGLFIYKTFSYTGNNVTLIVLSGDIPEGIDTNKALTYTANKLTSVNYS
jgi:hypothetical protein